MHRVFLLTKSGIAVKIHMVCKTNGFINKFINERWKKWILEVAAA